MMKKELVDNYAATRKALARRIMNSSLAANIGYPDAEHNYDLARLKEILDETAESPKAFITWTFLNVSFRGPCECGLSIELKVDERFSYTDLVDDKNNTWETYTLDFKINYPAHGGEDPMTVLARAAFIQRVAMLACELHAEFKDKRVTTITRSAEQKEKDADAEKKRKSDMTARQLVEGANLKNMRVGGALGISGDERVANVIVGKHEVAFNGKKYKLTVTEESWLRNDATIDRVA